MPATRSECIVHTLNNHLRHCLGRNFPPSVAGKDLNLYRTKISGSLDHLPPVQQSNLPVARHSPVKSQVARVGQPVGHMVI